MRKLLIGLLAVLILGAGAVYGGLYWVQRSAEREVDAALQGWRTSVGSATRGRVKYDVWTRTVRVSDVTLQAKASPGFKMSMARVVARGTGKGGSASRVEITNWEVASRFPGMVAGEMVQKAPKIVIEGYAGMSPPPAFEVKSETDLMRLQLELFAAITAKSITVPSLTMSMSLPAPPGMPAAPIEYAYSNIELRDLVKGRIAQATADGATLKGGMTGPPLGSMTGELGKMSIVDMDVGSMLAFFDPSRVKGDGYQRVYKSVSIGPYSIRFENGGQMRIDAITAEDVGFRPSKLSLNDIMFFSDLAATPGVPPSPAQMQMVLDKVAGLYEGMHLGKAEMQGMSFQMTPDPFKIGGITIDRLENGRLGAFVMEGLDGMTPQKQPIKIGRFALKGFDIGGMFRAMVQLGTPGHQPTPDQLTGLLKLLEGIELEQIAVPDARTGRQVQIDSLSAAWGQFVGVIPSSVRVSAKIAGPISVTDPEPLKTLAESGVFTMATNLDIGLAWSESSRALTLAPATVDLGRLFAVSAKASLASVPREVFSTDPARVMAAAAMAEVGTIELSLRDQGGLDLAAMQLAKAQGQPPQAARAMMGVMFAQNAQTLSEANPELRPVLEAIGRFMESNGKTLTITLTPRGRLPLLQLMESSQNPAAAAALLNRFTIEARVGG